MSKHIPPVRKYMTTFPHSIGLDQPLAHAHAVMREHGVRHLPVLEGGTLVGLISQRDLHLIETLKDVNPEDVAVEEAMSTEVYAIGPEVLLDEVVQTMADKKIGCAVIMQNQHVIGIFTTIDACQALADLLRGRPTK